MLKKTTIFTVILLAVIPAGFFSLPRASKQFFTSALKSVPYAVPASQIVGVGTVSSSGSQIVTPPQMSSAASCQTGGSAAGLNVQSQAKINFNQPASCFSLVTGMHEAANVHLAVAPLIQTAVSIVVAQLPQASIIPFALAPFIPDQRTALPAVAAIFAVLLEVAAIVKIKSNSKFSLRLQFLSYAMGIYRLQVMRC